jgi:hypothetical protein
MYRTFWPVLIAGPVEAANAPFDGLCHSIWECNGRLDILNTLTRVGWFFGQGADCRDLVRSPNGSGYDDARFPVVAKHGRKEKNLQSTWFWIETRRLPHCDQNQSAFTPYQRLGAGPCSIGALFSGNKSAVYEKCTCDAENQK